MVVVLRVVDPVHGSDEVVVVVDCVALLETGSGSTRMQLGTTTAERTAMAMVVAFNFIRFWGWRIFTSSGRQERAGRESFLVPIRSGN